MEIFDDTNVALMKYKQFFQDMSQANFTKKVEKMSQVQLDFVESEFDDRF